jgi:transcription initiation factor TFIID subunit 1, fungi type
LTPLKVDGEWETEIVRDQAVIAAYIRRRQLIEEESTKADALAPTGDAERDKRYKKRLEEEIARMKKNQERRLIRKNAKIIKDGGIPLQLRRPMKPDTTRRCGLCGQVGHMSGFSCLGSLQVLIFPPETNRKCPKWAEANMAANAGPAIPGVPGMPSGSGTPSGSAALGLDDASPTLSLPNTPSLAGPSDVRDSTPVASAAPKIKLTLKKQV